MALKITKESFKGAGITAGVLIGGLILLLFFSDTIIMPIMTRQGAETRVPIVTDLSYQAAETRLREAGLGAVNGGEEFDPKRPKGMVISQIPDGGSIVKKGRRVLLTLSKGSASAKVPNLDGFTLRDARLLLEKEGLRPGSIIWFTDPTRPDGVIISSMPPSGTVMKLNAEVQLIVNRAESQMTVKVPRFVGLDLNEAKVRAEENYLLIGDITYSVDDKLLPETVVAQSLAPGQEVSKWTAINLTISALE